MHPAEARQQAQRGFGSRARHLEDSRAVWTPPVVWGLWQDIRLALRRCARQPLFTLAATLILSVGIGANAALFSVLNALVLRPLAVAEPHRLATLSSSVFLEFGFPAGWEYALFEQLHRRQHLFAGIAAWSTFTQPVNLAPSGEVVAALFLVVAICAAVLPVCRATRVDPASVLRLE